MDDVDLITQNLMLRYLRKNYPVTKIRDGRRFKRGIILNEYVQDEKGRAFMSPREELNKTFSGLSNVLNDVFGVTQHEINVACLKYLNLL